MKQETRTIQSVQRALDIIECVAEAGRKVTLKYVSERLDMNINTARGLAQTLLVNGYLSKDAEQGTYSLGFEFYTKSTQLYDLQLKNIRDTAYPYMQKLTNSLNMTSCIQICFYREIYTLETLAPKRSPYAYVPNSATNLPLHVSASGKLLLAFLPEREQKKFLERHRSESEGEGSLSLREDFGAELEEIQECGYALELNEMNEGISCIAAPIFNMHGQLIATISVVASSQVLDPVLKQATREVVRAGEMITDAVSMRR